MINFISFFLKNYIKKVYLIYLSFALALIFANIIFIKYWIIEHPYQIDINGNLLINKIQFYFEEPINNLLNNKSPSNIIANIEFKISKMPLLIYFLYYFQIYVSKNLIITHLFKNLLLGSIIFILIKKYDKRLNNLFLISCILLIYFVPHNIVSMLAITPEESILIYFIIILFFLITGEYKYKNYFISIIIGLIFFTKASMVYLCFGISFVYAIHEKKRQKFLPVIFLVFCSFIWSLNSYYKTGKFTSPTSTTSLNGLSTGIVYHKNFTRTYPLMNPDIYWEEVLKEVESKNFKNEWEADRYILSKSIKYIIENPADVTYGILKKIYVILFSPFKDTRTIEQLENENKKNPIRYSNFINKPFFIISLILLLFSIINYSKINLKIKKISIYYLTILVFYFFPYITGFVFPRHCVAMYILGFIYILFFFTYKKKNFSNHNLFFKKIT
jgi:hypothetical protein